MSDRCPRDCNCPTRNGLRAHLPKRLKRALPVRATRDTTTARVVRVRRSQAASRANRDLTTVKRDVLIPRASVNGRPACERCGIYADTLDASHRLPQSASSVRNKDRHRPSALLLACRVCHEDMHAHPTIAYAAGWFVKRGEDPAVVPVRYRGRMRLLDDHGGVRPA